jgi:hypothetical protein
MYVLEFFVSRLVDGKTGGGLLKKGREEKGLKKEYLVMP